MSYERSPRALCSMTIGTRGMWLSFRQLVGCHADDSNQVVVKLEEGGARAEGDRDRGRDRRGVGRARDRGGALVVARGGGGAGSLDRRGVGGAAAPSRLVVV